MVRSQHRFNAKKMKLRTWWSRFSYVMIHKPKTRVANFLRWFFGPGMRPFRVVLALLFLTVLVVCLWFWWASSGIHYFARTYFSDIPVGRAAALGQAGDVFGGINALFAALAFLGVGVAGFFQYQSLEQTRASAKQQAFEQLFFHLLEQQRELSTSQSIRVDYLVTTGRGGFKTSWKTPGDLASEIRDLFAADSGPLIEFLQKTYRKKYIQHEYALGPYFRSLYQLFKLIDRSDIAYDQKIQYANIARSTLNSNEVLLLALNADSGWGRDFKVLVERYGLLKHFRADKANPLVGRIKMAFAAEDDEFSLERQRTHLDQVFIDDRFKPTACLDSRGRLAHWKKHGGFPFKK